MSSPRGAGCEPIRLDQRLVRERIGRVDIDETTLGLRHDLLGDDEAVAVLKVSVVGGGDQFSEIVAGRTSPMSWMAMISRSAMVRLPLQRRGRPGRAQQRHPVAS